MGQNLDWNSLPQIEKDKIREILPEAWIPDMEKVKRIIVLSQTSHNDWDWNATFAEFYSRGGPRYSTYVKEVLHEALSILRLRLLRNGSSAPPETTIQSVKSPSCASTLRSIRRTSKTSARRSVTRCESSVAQ